MGIFEVLPINETLKELIVQRGSSQQIWKAARREGLKTMMEDGFIKVGRGITTLEEIFRVIS
jgi:type IV pilus assembly protein PilB